MDDACNPKNAVILCPASAKDLEDLVAIRIEAMRESLERIGRFDPERARERFVSGFDVNCTRRIELSGELVGFVVVKSQPDELLLEHLYVRPHVQGLGVGSVVLQQLFEEADEVGLPIRVGALKESDSNRFYTRHGFVLVASGEFDHYYVRAARPIANDSNSRRWP